MLIDELYNNNRKDPGFAVQKFNRLLAKGLVRNHKEVTILSAPPIGRHNSSKLFWHRAAENHKELTYQYLSFINVPGIRQLCLIIGTFYRTLLWTIKRPKKNAAVICDVLNASISSAAIVACKISRTQIVGVMTDMPGLMVNFDKKQTMSFSEKIATNLIKWCFSNYDKFVFLTEAMNIVNKRNRPYIVMEGISDDSMASERRCFEEKQIRTIMYAGGLHERYGLKKLTEAFMMLSYEDIQLKIFGNGPFVDELEEKYCKQDCRIQYMGVRPNEEIVLAELDASLLVNPRPTHEDFTKYSFPSKNIEYMASGTPLLTTKLPGMPSEYYPYVYLVEDESTEGYAKALLNALSKSAKELYDYGARAKIFVLEKKNSCKQAHRVIELIKQ